MYENPDIGMPIILNLYWMACKISTPTFLATNSVQKTDNSMIDCFLEYHMINDVFIYIMNLVLDLLMWLLLAWLLSTNILRSTSLPLGIGALGGIASTAPLIRSLSTHILKNYSDLHQDRKGQMLIWSYAWASVSPWFTMLPPNAPVMASLNDDNGGLFGIYIDRSYFNHQPHYSYSGLAIRCLIWSQYLENIQLRARSIWNSLLSCFATYSSQILTASWTYLDGLNDQAQIPFHALMNCVPMHTRTLDLTRLKWHVPIQFIQYIIWTMMDTQDVLHIA